MELTFNQEFRSFEAVPKRKPRKKRVPHIGFEWEIGLKDGYWSRFTGAQEERFKDDSSLNSFNIHRECGCFEFAGPVSPTVANARKYARYLIRKTGVKNSFLTHGKGINSSGGIHVSASNSGKVTDEMALKIIGMCNRKSSKEFIWKFSGRWMPGNEIYSRQGKTLNWDAPHGDELRLYPINSMFKTQDHRLEYRLWTNHAEFLIPAIEFAHSTWVFCSKCKEDIPYLKDYKKWLFKQPGYKALKNFEHADWSLIND